MLTLVIGNKNYSSWSLRPWLAMKQAGLEFQEIRIPLDTPDTRRQILQYSPSGKVPVLLHNDLVIWESLAICEYLAEQFPDYSWYPTSTDARAIARCVSAEMHAGFAPLRQQMSMDCRARHPLSTISPAVQQDIDRIFTLWRDCRTQYGGNGDFLFGDFSIADAMFAPVVSRFITYGVAIDPDLQPYTHAVWSLPSMQEWLSAAAAEIEVLPNH